MGVCVKYRQYCRDDVNHHVIEVSQGGDMLLDKEKSCLVLVDVQDKLTPLVMESQNLIQRAQWLLALATALNIPMLMNMQYPKGLGQTVEALKNFSFYAQIEKTAFSCCDADDFNKALKAIHKNQVILIGIETHVCVLQTALTLLTKGYDVFVVIDAVSARHKVDHQYALKRMKQQGCHLVTSEMVFFEWIRDAAHPNFKSLSQAFLKESS